MNCFVGRLREETAIYGVMSHRQLSDLVHHCQDVG